MTNLLFSRTTVVWFILVAATLLSWEVGHGVGFDDLRHAGAAIIVIAFIKARYVILDFMEIRHAPRAMRLVGEAWVVLVCVAVTGLMLAAPVSS